MSPYRRRLPAEAASTLDQLSEAVELYRAETQRLADQLAVAAVACIEAGATWGEVGRRLGISKQAARAHWARYLDRNQPEPE